MDPGQRSANEGGDDRSSAVTTFESHRPHLLGVAYRILGSVTDAEDVLQEAWLRWSRTDRAVVSNSEAFLTTIVGRLSLDHLRRAKARRETYTGSWLPEPIVSEPDPQRDPAAAAELADSLSMALLVVLETLSPLERAAFVLREVFERPYPEVAATLGRNEAAIRQLVHRARDRVDVGHARFQADLQTHAKVVDRFLEACANADVEALMEILAPDVVIISDSGGLVTAPRRPIHGRDKVARLLASFAPRVPAGTTFSIEHFNGALGVVARLDGVTITTMAMSVAGGRVQSLQLVANPQKLVFMETHPDLW
jgi:RNA polymerase sigma-70 factor (TIGR02957 family)